MWYGIIFRVTVTGVFDLSTLGQLLVIITGGSVYYCHARSALSSSLTQISISPVIGGGGCFMLTPPELFIFSSYRCRG